MCSLSVQPPQASYGDYPDPGLKKDQQGTTMVAYSHNLVQFQPFTHRKSRSCLTTDASKAGWGAYWGDISGSRANRLWPLPRLDINRLELLAVHLALRELPLKIRGQIVRVRCDTFSLVIYIPKEGTRRRSLSLHTVGVFPPRDLSEHHLGADNKLADAQSSKVLTVQQASGEGSRNISEISVERSCVSDAIHPGGKNHP